MLSALRVGAVAVALAAAALLGPGAASADQQSSVQARISALQNQLAATGARVHQLTAGYASAEAEVQSIAEQAAVEQVQARRAAAALAQSSTALRQELIAAYVGGIDQPSGATTVSGDVANPSVRFGYLSIATSTMQDSVDSYRTAQLNLNSALAALAAQQRAAEAAAGAADRARQAALDEATAATARLTGLEAQLTALEDKAAAQRAAANQAASSGGAGTGSQGGPVNGGLVSIVRTQVQAPAPTDRAPAPGVSVTPPTPPAPPTLPPPAPPTLPPPAPPASPPAVSPASPPAPTGSTASSGSGSANVWLQLRQCESGDDYQANTGNGFYGAYQFSQQTWSDLGYPGRPDQEPPAMQDQAAQRLQAQSGWGQWPACSAALGLT